MLRADTTDLRRFEEVVLLAKSWRGAQLTQLRELSLAAQGCVQGSRAEFTCRGQVQGSQGDVTCQGHTSCPEWSAFTNGWSNNSADFSSQRSCQLVVRLKAIKCDEGLLCYLSFSTSGLLFITVTTLFVAILLGLKEVERCRHSPWNPNPVWDKPLGKACNNWPFTPYGWCTE